ncbi:MAG: putative ABC exporter domain-containing protein [Syntrophomonadaceae bacterium]
MTGPLAYLYLTRLKNSIKELFKKPARLIYVLFLFALMVFSLTSGGARMGEAGFRDPAELTAMATALYILMFLLTVHNGFSRGGSIFTMSDVNLLFPAPLSHSRVLFYGLFRHINTSLLLGLFILFQYGWLSRTYGVSLVVMFGLFLGYVATVFLGQITAMTIYIFTSSDEALRNRWQAVVWFLTALLVLYTGLYVWQHAGEGVLSAATTVANSLMVRCFPVGGWLGWTFAAFVSGASLVPGLLASLVWLALLVCLINFSNRDWYEDVLKTTELTQSVVAAQREGNLEALPDKVRVGRTGFDEGWGADTFYYKHRIENRRGGVFLLSRNSLIFAVFIIIMALFMRKGGIVAVFSLATYMQLFTTRSGRINKELTKPFIYLVPEPPFVKLVQNLREMLPGALVEAVVIFVPVGLILGLGGPDICACILARVSFALLFAAGNIVVERFWSGASKALTMLLYITVMTVLAAPGAALALVVSSNLLLISENFIVFLVMAIVNIPVSLLVLFLCRNMLQYAELN